MKTNQRGWSLIILLPVAALGVLLQGCHTPHQTSSTASRDDARVDFSDPVLNQRQIFLFGKIDQRAAEATIQKLLYLDSKSHDPIDLYIQSPGDEKQDSLVIEHAFRIIKSPVNTWTFTGCNSGGALLLASGTGKRRTFRGAVIILHGLTWRGNPPPDYTKPIQDDYMQLWRKRARLPDAWLPFPFGVIHMLSAEQALEYGIVDEVIDR
jgi:ATP-dependent Clp protease protease subunit